MEFKNVSVYMAILAFVSEGCYGIKIGAFNIQVFGTKKMSDESVVNILVDIVSRYDILLIQEIRDASGEAIQKLLEEVNAKYAYDQFDMELSPRLGRTSSKEQYAFLFRKKSGLTVVRAYVYDDRNDIFQREPYVVLFHSTTTTVDKFALIGIHVSPSDAVEEIQALEAVFENTTSHLNEENVMVLGDLNADCSYVPKKDWVNIPMKTDPAYTWWIDDDADTTVGNSDCAYDRFISTGDKFKDGVMNGSVIIFKYDDFFNLNQTFALQVSDHYPIEFVLETKNAMNGCSSYEGKFGHVCLTLFALLTVVLVCEKHLTSPERLQVYLLFR